MQLAILNRLNLFFRNSRHSPLMRQVHLMANNISNFEDLDLEPQTSETQNPEDLETQTQNKSTSIDT